MCRSHDRTSLIGALAMTLALAAPTMALAEPITAQADPNEPRTVRLTVYPAAPPAVAMQHRLLPRYLDLVPGNAAVQYLKALPEGGDADIKKHAERIEELLEQEREAFQVDEARKILQEFATMYQFLQLASVREDCDWNLPIREQDIYSILLPELQSMRQFGRILALKARVQIADGELDGAIGTLRVGYAAARNTTKGPTLVNALVGVAITRIMNERLLELIEHANAPNLYWSIAALPDPFIDVGPAMGLESDGVYLMFPQLKDVATAKLTDEQWSLRLSEFAAKLQSLGPIDVPEGNWQNWKNSLARSLGVAAVAMANHSRAKADLESYGWPKEQLDRMVIPQLILLHIGQTYEMSRDELFKWFHVPYWQAHGGTEAAETSLAKNRSREILPLASILLPALSNARFAIVRLQREMAAIRTVEALRLHAAKHDGALPGRLEDIKDVPVPLDPVTGKMFEYKLDGHTATLEGKSPEGRTPESGAFRFIVAIAEKKAAGSASVQMPPMRKPGASGEQSAAATASEVAVTFTREFVDFVTNNPGLKIGANRRRARSIDNLRRISLALANYSDIHKRYPPAASVDQNGKPLLSWRVLILPYLDHGDLYRQFKLDEPWNSEHNKKLIEKMPAVYRVPALPSLPEHTTTYLVPVGKETVFHDDKGTPIKEIRDGVSSTIFIVEADADQAVLWTKPGDWQFDAKKSNRGLGTLRGDRFLAAFGDASVHQLSPERDKERIPALFTRAAGDRVTTEPAK